MTTSDGLQLHKDGTIRLTLANQTWRIARPTLGQMRKLHELWQGNVADQIGQEGTTDEQIETAVLAWIGDVLRTLSDTEPFEVSDDLPPWIVNASIGARFINHWRTLPLQSGG